MIDLISYAVSIALYVLQALGLYAIAQRRGIARAWLAWVPIGNLWLLASIADDFKQKTRGKQRKLRYWLPSLAAVTTVLSVVILVVMFVNVLAPMMQVLTYEDLMTIYEMQQGDSVSHMYAPAEEEMIEDIAARLDAVLTDEMMENMLGDMLLALGLSLLLLPASIATAVIECICLYDLFSSCDPQSKILYFLLSLLVGLQGVFIFVCRDKDLGMAPPPELPGGQPNYWQQS